MRTNGQLSKTDRFFKVLALAIILLGIAVRLAVLLQNRNLFIDEANVARNIYERNIFQLATPLSYEQYAPPVFLWILKLCTFLFGYGEIAFRLYPFLASIGSFIMMYLILKELTSVRTLWYPIGLFAVGFMSIRYSTELKQYISDSFIILAIIWLALKTDISLTPSRKFILIWLAAGSLAIWTAMPSVFALTGVALYYCHQIITAKQFRKIGIVAVTALLWLGQFGLYYMFILKPQIESSHLQNFHSDFFLFATPENADEWQHNWDVIKYFIQETSGFWDVAFTFHLLLLILGCVFFLIRDTGRSMLVLVPIGATFVAAALNQFSLIPRVSLFLMPLILIVIGYGLHSIVRLKPLPLSLLLLPVGILMLYKFSSVKMMWERFESEEITDAMDFVIRHQITDGGRLYIHHGACPAFIYYTQIHPERKRWNRIKDAYLVHWTANYDSQAAISNGITAHIFTSIDANELNARRATISKYCDEIAQADKQGSHAYIFRRK